MIFSGKGGSDSGHPAKEAEKFHTLSEDELRKEAAEIQVSATEILEMGRSKAMKEHKVPFRGKASPGQSRPSTAPTNKTTATKMPSPKADTSKAGGYGVPQNADERIDAALELMQAKYEQNVKVVEMLFDEKRQLEQHISELQDRMNPALSLDGTITRSITGGTFDEQVAAAQRVASPERAVMGGPKRADSPTRKGTDNKARGRAGTGARSMSAGSKRPTGTSPSKVGAASLGAVAAANLFGGGKSSQSMRQSQFVLRLQADSDRYMQRKKGAEEKELKERLDHEAYEQEKYKRLLRAKNAGPFKGMMERAERSAELNRERAEKKKREAEEKERSEAEMRRKKRIDHINKELPSGELTWKEMEEQATAARVERIEKRKIEVSMTSKAPGIGRETRRRNRTPEVQEVKKVEDPERVSARLALQQKRWKAKIEEIQMQNKQKMAAMRSSVDPKVLSMEKRIEQNTLKRKAKEDERARVKQEEEEAKVALQKKALEKLMGAKVPEASRKLTKSAQNRAILVRKAADAKEAKLRAEEKEERARNNKLKAMGAVMKNVVQEREVLRKSQCANYTELAGSEGRAAQLAQEARREFREKLRANKKKLAEARAGAPTLMQRLDIESAGARAGNKFSATVRDAMGNSQGEGDGDGEDDLFSDYEKAKLGL